MGNWVMRDEKEDGNAVMMRSRGEKKRGGEGVCTPLARVTG